MVCHAIPLGNGKDTYIAYGNSDKDETSVIETEEREIVKWLFTNKMTNDFLLRNLIEFPGHPHSFHFEMKEPILNRNEMTKIGDIDFLIYPQSRPDLATAIEFKKVKVFTKPNGEVKINRLDFVNKKGMKQVKQIRKLGFHKTYLGIIIEDDGRHTDEISTMHKTSKSDNVDRIFNTTNNPELEQVAGVLYIVINQPTGESVQTRFNLQFCLHKPAIKINQSVERTNRIKDLIKSLKLPLTHKS